MISDAELTELVTGLAGLPYDGEAVDQRSHALQCAALAVAAGADDALVLAAALHDVGRAEPVRAAWPGLPHEEAGAAFARRWLDDQVAWLIGRHVPAKRYLVATDPAYYAQLSPVSVQSLERQGGPMDAEQVREFAAHPLARSAVALRRWDEAAKVPDGTEIPIPELLTVLARYRTRSNHR